MSTSGFLTVIVVPSFETSVGAFSTVGVSSDALAVASVAGASAAGVVGSVAEVAVSEVGATVSVAGCALVTSSAEALGAMIARSAAVRITPQRPNALDFTNPSLMFLLVIISIKAPL